MASYDIVTAVWTADLLASARPNGGAGAVASSRGALWADLMIPQRSTMARAVAGGVPGATLRASALASAQFSRFMHTLRVASMLLRI